MIYFSTKPISFERAINIKLKNIKILNGNPILKKFGGYPPKKVRVQDYKFFYLFNNISTKQ